MKNQKQNLIDSKHIERWRTVSLPDTVRATTVLRIGVDYGGCSKSRIFRGLNEGWTYNENVKRGNEARRKFIIIMDKLAEVTKRHKVALAKDVDNVLRNFKDLT